MADAMATYKRILSVFINSSDFSNEDKSRIIAACIHHEALTNNREAICQSIDALTRAIKESGQ